jgi:hypothetical protein
MSLSAVQTSWNVTASRFVFQILIMDPAWRLAVDPSEATKRLQSPVCIVEIVPKTLDSFLASQAFCFFHSFISRSGYLQLPFIFDSICVKLYSRCTFLSIHYWRWRQSFLHTPLPMARSFHLISVILYQTDCRRVWVN